MEAAAGSLGTGQSRRRSRKGSRRNGDRPHPRRNREEQMHERSGQTRSLDLSLARRESTAEEGSNSVAYDEERGFHQLFIARAGSSYAGGAL